ncbi:MAG: hypothetical protein U9N46_12980 [Euryarchaeota archaeon]|nr:hypothetical protein [Euryarchaeota archaeon]
MARRPHTTELRIVLRTILSAGVLAVLLLACVGVAAGATWVVDDGGGADFASIQAAVDAASDGDTIEVASGTCEDDVVNVKFRGVVTGHPDFSCLVGASGINVQIDEILSDPTANLEIEDTVTVAFAVAPPFCYINDMIGDSVEVYSVYRDIEEMPDCWLDVGEHWVWLGASDHYFKILDQQDPPDKSLLELEGQSIVYWFQNGRSYWVWDVINDMSEVTGWDNVITLEFNPAGYPNGPIFIATGAESNGLLIREQGHHEVYVISGGEKHHFTSPEALLRNGYSFDDVVDVSAQIIAMFPSGYDISVPTPPPTLLNYNPVPAITPPGMLSLIALLALAGFVVLRRKE